MVSPPSNSKAEGEDLDIGGIGNGDLCSASARRLFAGVGAASTATASSAKSPVGRGVTSSSSTAIITHIRHALDESTRCMSLQQPPGKNEGSGYGYAYSTGSTAPLSCPAGYLSYSPFRRRWDVYYRNTLTGAGNTGFATSSTPTIVVHAHRISIRRSSDVVSPSDYRLSSPPIQADDGTIAPPPKVLQTTLRLVELRRMLELVVAQSGSGGGTPAISSRVQTRQMTIVSLGSVLSDLLELECGKSDDDGNAVSPMQSIRYVKLLRCASAEAIRKALAMPIECSVGDDTDDAYMWRLVLADSYEAQLGPRSGELSPTTCQCNDDQIDYVQKFVKDCLALDRIVDMMIEGGYVQRKGGIDCGYFGRAAISTSSADYDSDSSSDVQIIEGPAVAQAAATVVPVPLPPIPAPSPPVLSLTSSGRRPKRMRESVRRSPSLDGSVVCSRNGDEAAATVAVAATIANKESKYDHTTTKSAGEALSSPDQMGKNIQLYASTFGAPQADQGRCEGGRPKRKIKQVIRFNADPIPYKVQRSAAETAKSGNGFNCPACMAVVSYDSTQCPSCQLRCQYAPGAGVQIIKERGDVLSSASDDIKFGKMEAATPLNNIKQTTGQSSVEEKRVLRARPKRASPMLTEDAAVSTGQNKTKEEKKNKQTKTAPKTKPKIKAPPNSSALEQPTRYNPANLPVSAQRLFAVAPGIVECEACLKLFSQSSVQGHRRRLHGLKANQLACAHCELIFPTKEERHEHIRTSHPGKPVGVNSKTIARHKLYQYLCPYCEKAFSLIDLEMHLSEAHSTTLDKVRRDVLWACPFCPGGRSKKTFPDHHSLKFHCEEAHDECQLLGAILFVPGVSGKRYRETKKGRSKSPLPSTSISEPPRRYYAQAEPTESDDEAPLGEDEEVEENPFVLHRLSIKPLDLLNATTISRELLTSNPSTTDILTTVNSTVEALEETIEVSCSVDEGLEKEYSDEARLYARTIRERGVKAESEKLEKEKYKAICDEQQMMWEYENRGKKRSANSLEEEALLSRPIKYEKRPVTSASAATGACCAGEGCRLCDGTHASELVTEAEMNEAGGDISKIIPIPFGGAKASEGATLVPINQLLMPEIKEIDVDDYLADSDVEQEEKEENKEKEKRPSRRKQKAEQALSELGYLCRLRHTLSFVEEYNEDLLPAIQRNPKNYHV